MCSVKSIRHTRELAHTHTRAIVHCYTINKYNLLTYFMVHSTQRNAPQALKIVCVCVRCVRLPEHGVCAATARRHNDKNQPASQPTECCALDKQPLTIIVCGTCGATQRRSTIDGSAPRTQSRFRSLRRAASPDALQQTICVQFAVLWCCARCSMSIFTDRQFDSARSGCVMRELVARCCAECTLEWF